MLSTFIKYNKRVLIIIFSFVIILIALSYINASALKNNNSYNEDIYENKLASFVARNEFDDINYDLVKKDFDDMGNIIKEQISLNLENNVESESYIVADKIYTEKLTEFSTILSHKLDTEAYSLYREDLETFGKELSFTLESKKNEILSTTEYVNFKNQYSYMAKQDFLYKMLEKYKTYLE